MATPGFKVYNADGEYVAATIDTTLAAALVGSVLSEGARVKFGGRIIWREGAEEIPAGESYDRAAEIMADRVTAHWAERRYGYGAARARLIDTP